MSPLETTIVGVATGTPDGGVAIIRLSGPKACAIAGCLVGVMPAPRVLARRSLRERGGGAAEDALVVWMPAPRSLTGEDVVELHVHAGESNVRQIVESLLTEGALAAGPGEFTRRAFERGRLSLEQAEGISALIAARTQAGVEQARRLVAGELGREVDALREAVGELRVEIEANLDFPEDVAEGDLAKWREEVSARARTVAGWLRRFEAGRRARSRPRVVISGPPNAGKSALFNALLGRPRAIVSPVPGTTRDYVEAELRFGALEVLLVDTAGLRGAVADPVEHEGIERSREQISGADVVLWVEAADAAPVELVPEGALRVESKRDLSVARSEWIGVSVVSGEGIEALQAAILERLRPVDGEEPWIGLARHRDRAADAGDALAEAERGFVEPIPLEIVAFQLSVAERHLAEITGRDALGPIGEGVLARIFSRFCIGK